MAPADLLDGAVERTVLSEHVGKSGAALERVRLHDGRALVVKRVTVESDLTLSLLGGDTAREYLLWQSGTLGLLPRGVGHAVVDGWIDGDATVIVMRDLGPAVLTWEDHLTRDECAWVLERVARMHETFRGAFGDSHPPMLAPLGPLLGLFAPSRMGPLAAQGNALAAASVRGWEYFPDLVPPDVADPVFALLEDPTALAQALTARPCTLAHGDLATVNMALVGDELVLLDWAMPVVAPGALDIARFLAGCGHVIEPGRDEFLTMYAGAAGPSYDRAALRLALLAAFVWLGWNKAQDIVEHQDPAVREREVAGLAWWVRQARTALDSGAW